MITTFTHPGVGWCIVPGKVFHIRAGRVILPETLHHYTPSDVSIFFEGIFENARKVL